ncbi:MAG: C45 family peptidase [Phycisphaerales bacterium]|nr:C45 family peptidase [Phycisphaerales bacterium]
MCTLSTIEVHGSPSDMGQALGEGLRPSIERLMARRRASAADYLRERGLSGGDLSQLGAACLQVLRGWDPRGWDEHRGVARGAGVNADELYALVNLTDVRDLACIPAQTDAEGCTAVLIPAAASLHGTPLGGQTWDLISGDVEDIIAVRRTPDEGPATWSVTVAGAPSLMGMNETGLAVGTTNIKVAGARIGVGYMSLLHRALACSDRREVATCIGGGPRIGAHTYWAVDPMGALELECDAMSCTQREALTVPLVRTNHCLHPARQDAEPPSESSLQRLARAGELESKSGLTVEDLRAVFSDRRDGLNSINRRHEDGEPTATNACVIADPSKGVLHACRGEADQGQWIELHP